MGTWLARAQSMVPVKPPAPVDSGSTTSERNDKTTEVPSEPTSEPEARTVGTTAVDLIAVAELLVAGQALGWPRLEAAPHLTILAGEANWLNFLEFPAPGALEAALAVAKECMEQELPI